MKVNWGRIIENLITLFIGTICVCILVLVITLIEKFFK